MPKRLLATTIILLIAITMLSLIPLSGANFIPTSAEIRIHEPKRQNIELYEDTPIPVAVIIREPETHTATLGNMSNPISGNTTLTGLSDGFYKILLYAFAEGKGGSRAYLEFTVSHSMPTINTGPTLQLELNPSKVHIILAIVTAIFAIALVSLVYFKKRKQVKLDGYE